MKTTLIDKFLGAPWFGHGRMSELGLAFTCFLYAMVVLFIPSSMFASTAVEDLAWQGYGRWIAMPFLVKAVLTGGGLLFNIKGWPGSQFLRITGSLMGCYIWMWFVWKYAFVLHMYGSIAVPLLITNLFFSIRVMALSLAGLPIPGAPGRVA